MKMMSSGINTLLKVITWMSIFDVFVLGADQTHQNVSQRNASVKDISAEFKAKLKKYDKMFRPSIGGSPDVISVDMIIISMGRFEESKENFQLKFYFRQFWTDSRLNISEDLSLTADAVDKLWVPDTYFVNADSAFVHNVTFANRLVQVNKGGQIVLSARLSVTAGCNMRLHKFPMDFQQCSLRFLSYGYNNNSLLYNWRYDDDKDNVQFLDFASYNPDFDIIDVVTTAGVEKYKTTGAFTNLEVQFHLQRKFGFFVIYFYVPATFLVVLSWASFWMDKDQAPARIALGMTTALTLSEVLSGVQRSLPKVSYAKSIDIYLVVCFLFVFASLFEYVFVNFFSRGSRPIKSLTHEMRRLVETHSQREGKAGNEASKSETATDGMSNGLKRRMVNDDSKDVDDDENKNNGSRTKIIRNYVAANANKCDRYCRVLFPLSFGLFSLIYWMILLID